MDNPNDEATARRLVAAIDAARVRADCAVILEAHSGHGEWGKNRSTRPVGSSLYLRWPEFGYGLRPAEQSEGQGDKDANERPTRVEMCGWRGARDERSWPREWVFGSLHGVDWPWVPYDRFSMGAVS